MSGALNEVGPDNQMSHSKKRFSAEIFNNSVWEQEVAKNMQRPDSDKDLPWTTWKEDSSIDASKVNKPFHSLLLTRLNWFSRFEETNLPQYPHNHRETAGNERG